MTRFHGALFAAMLGVGLALAMGQVPLLATILAVFITLSTFGVITPRFRYFGPFICRGSPQGRQVALTFDDGPDARSTPVLLDFLRDAKVQATFFCVGARVAAEPELAARIVRDGHLLENHSYAHSNATNFFTVRRLRADLAQSQEAIEKATGKAPRCYRPPMGLSNPRVFRAARALGLKVIGWSNRGFDTTFTEPERIVARITRRLRPGAIILLHDGNIPADRLLKTVKTLLDTVHTLGYEVVRLDRMLT